MKDVSEPFYLSDMADGAVRMLLWAVILLSWELPSLLVLDVPETGLHPAWMKTLSEWIKMTAENTQVIVITHNPDLLDGFTDKWQNVVSFNTDGRGRFFPTRLEETLLLPKMAEGWELGDLYRVGDPAVEGWPW
jgi:predicted ATPase